MSSLLRLSGLSHAWRSPDFFALRGRALMQIAVIILLLWIASNTAVRAADLRLLEYDGFSILMDCEMRSAIWFSYQAGPDTGRYRRHSSFRHDPELSPDCQQLATRSYSSRDDAYVRAQLVPSNHMDHRQRGIRETSYFTNILPMARNMNRGAWYRTELIIECYRDRENLTVYGGPVFGPDRDRDHFSSSHGVKTPVEMWKLVIAEDRFIAWIIPNIEAARWSRLDDYIVPVRLVETRAGQHFEEIAESEKDSLAGGSWALPDNCDPG